MQYFSKRHGRSLHLPDMILRDRLHIREFDSIHKVVDILYKITAIEELPSSLNIRYIFEKRT